MRPSAHRHLFNRPTVVFAKVRPDGFLLSQTEELVSELKGRVMQVIAMRKLFDGAVLACQSRDGATSQDGARCEECRHPRCRPVLRLRLADGRVHYLLDLAISSARNLIALEERLERQGSALEAVPLQLSVSNRGRYGVVEFAAR